MFRYENWMLDEGYIRASKRLKLKVVELLFLCFWFGLLQC
jgi:hypothetical protein